MPIIKDNHSSLINEAMETKIYLYKIMKFECDNRGF